MLNFKCFFKPTLVDIAQVELYSAERALLSAKVNKSFCESEIAYNTARIGHLRAAISEKTIAMGEPDGAQPVSSFPA
jgi:hypothetical protein